MRSVARKGLALLAVLLVVLWVSRPGPSAPLRHASPSIPTSGSTALPPPSSTSPIADGPSKGTTPLQLPGLLSKNDGSQPAEVKYTLRDHNASVFFTENGITASVIRNGHALAVRQAFVGSSCAGLLEGEATSTIVNTYVGDSSQWKTGQKTVRDLRYHGVWPKIDVVYEPRPGALEYTVHIAPGGDPASIRFNYEGVEALRIDESGELVLQTALGELKETKPVAWQQTPHGVKPVSSRFRMLGDRTYGIEVDAYDRTLALVIDPVLSYSTFFGSGYGSPSTSASSTATGIVVDGAGNVYMVGNTGSDFPTTPGAYQPTLLVGYGSAMYVTKINAGGASLAWSTLILGSDPQISKCAVDSLGNVIIVGLLTTAGLPTTPGAVQSTVSGDVDGFALKVASGGGSLVWSTLMGGNHDDRLLSVGVDAADNVYVAGSTLSNTFPATIGAANGRQEVVLARFSPTGNLDWCTLVGGINGAGTLDMAVDATGRTYVLGGTDSPDFPITPGAYDPTFAFPSKKFLFQMNASGTAIGWSTFIADPAQPLALALDSAQNVYVTGWAQTGYYTSPGALETSTTAGTCMFATKYAAGGGSILWSTFIGGAMLSIGFRIAVDGSGVATILGRASADGFPVTPGAIQATRGGMYDLVLCRLNATGTARLWATYLGGDQDEQIGGLSLDSSGNAYVAGWTNSANYPKTPGAYTSGGAGYAPPIATAFISRINAAGTSLDWSTILVGSYGDTPGGVAADASGNIYITGSSFSAEYPTTIGAYQPTRPGARSVVLSKMKGNQLVWSTFFGGSGLDYAHRIRLDAAGDILIAGDAGSADFPTTPGAYQTTHKGPLDQFIAKFTTAGALVWSTLLGGSGKDYNGGFALGPGGEVFISGSTDSTDFPVTAGAWSQVFAGGPYDGYVSCLNSTGTALVWSTYFGGTGDDQPLGLAVDSSGNAYVTGQTSSGDFPTSGGAYDTTYAGSTDAFVVKVLSGGAMGWSTFLGGPGSETGWSIALDSSSNPCIVGSAGPGFPTTTGAYRETINGTFDAFAAKIKSDGTALLWSTYLGGSATEGAYTVAVRSTGTVVVAGYTWSTDFPTTPDGYQLVNGGATDAFVSELSADGSSLVWSTYLGGISAEAAYNLYIDPFDNIVVTGPTQSSDFPTTPDAVDTTYGGAYDFFVARFGNAGPPPPPPPPPPPSGGGGGGGGGGGCGLLGLDSLMLALVMRRARRSRWFP